MKKETLRKRLQETLDTLGEAHEVIKSVSSNEKGSSDKVQFWMKTKYMNYDAYKKNVLK